MQVSSRIAYLPGSPVSEPTSLPAAVVADTIMRTVELGVTITDAAVDGDVTVVFCDLLTDGRQSCPGCGSQGIYRDTAIRNVTDVPVVGHPLLAGSDGPRSSSRRQRAVMSPIDRRSSVAIRARFSRGGSRMSTLPAEKSRITARCSRDISGRRSK